MKGIGNSRIVLVLGTLEMGGAERQAWLLATHLLDVYGAHVEIWGLSRPGGRLAELCDSRAIPHRHVAFRWPCRLSTLARRLLPLALTLRAARPDAILAYTTWANVACGLTWRMTGARTFLWGQRNTNDWRDQGAQRAALRSTPCVVSNSHHAARYLAERTHLSEGDIHVIPNGVAPEPVSTNRSTWRERLGVGADDTVVCMLANFRPQKDHVALLRAWRIVMDRMAAAGPAGSAALVLAGRAAETQSEMRELAASLGLSESVRFAGEVRDVAGLLGASEIGVLSTRWEGLPNAVLEYMATGLPVVATDVPGVREALGPDTANAFAPPGSEAALAEGILRFARDGKLRQHVGQANRARSRSAFSPNAMCTATATLIEEWLSRPRRGRRA